MTEYEWETRRVARPTRPEFIASHHHRSTREVAEFAALEHPRESVGWILRQHAQAKELWPTRGRARPTKGDPAENPPTPSGPEA